MATGEAPGELTREQLWDQYGRAIAEYRFQVELNWRRSQYFFVLNAAVFAAGVALVTSSTESEGLAIAVFFTGVVICVLALFATSTQHGYYKAARDVKARLEERLEMGDAALTTTPGMGSPVRRLLGRVTTLQRVMLVALLAANVVGALFAVEVFDDAGGPVRSTAVEVVGRISPAVNPGRDRLRVVVSKDGKAVAKASGSDGEFALRLPPGDYRVWTLLDRICVDPVRVTEQPLQVLTMRCQDGARRAAR